MMISPSIFRPCSLAAFVALLLSNSILHAQILPAGATPKLLVTNFVFTESPLYDGNGGVYFSDINSDHIHSRLFRYNISTGIASLVDPAPGSASAGDGGANGDYFNASHQIVSADRDRQQISLRSAADVSVVQTVLTSTFNGIKYNGPNDLVIDNAGGIYFSDPDYENRHTMAEGFYYINPQGVVSQLLTFTGGAHPNGVVLSPDQHTLYLALEGSKKIMAYDLNSPGTLTNARTFATAGTTNGPDGLTIDPAGNVYTAGQNAVLAWTPAGQSLFTLAFPEDPTNLDFGGTDGKTLFVAAGKSLYSIQLNVAPEPSTIALLATGMSWLLIRGKNRVPLRTQV